VLAAEPQGQPDAQAARKMVEKSLPFLEKEGVAWLETKKCATCHHIPMMLWTHYEAKKHGLTVNEKAMQRLEAEALKQYLGHPQFQPAAQDTSFFEKPLGPGTVYLSLALRANPTPGEEAIKALERFSANFVKHQNENGSWTTKMNQPPLIDEHDGITLAILLAMHDGGPKGQHAAAWERAVKWLKDNPGQRDDTQVLAYRILVAQKSGDKAEAQRRVEQLRKQQQQSGGWRQKSKLEPDAFATGQAIYALRLAGVPSDDPVVRRAEAFLAATQKPDGSWLVHAQNPRGHDPVISFVGTGWATLGLLQTLPK
jgi:hypothetical protein